MKLTVVQFDLRGRSVFLRADFNVLLSGDEITEDSRIRAVVPTIECCLRNGASAVRNLVSQVDRMLIGGAMAFTFLKALGRETGRSPVEWDLVPTAKAILEEAAARRVEVLLPEDVVAAVHAGDRDGIRTVPTDRIPVAVAGLDIGPVTVTRFQQALRDTGTVVWNGPMGVVEQAPFASGTEELAKAVASACGLTVAAGGDTVAAVRRAGVADKLGYLSPSGAAFLKALEGQPLPGLAVLSDVDFRPVPAAR